MKNLKDALYRFNVHCYADNSCMPLYNAQNALAGRTHYADDGTLKYFGARINRAWASRDGLIFHIVESVKHPSLGRVHRYVAFDVFGTVLTERDAFRKSGAACQKDIDAFRSFDAVAHTESELRYRIERSNRDNAETLAILNNEGAI